MSQTNRTDRQTGQDRTGQDRQWSDSIGRTVLQTVTQKSAEKIPHATIQVHKVRDVAVPRMFYDKKSIKILTLLK